MSLDDWVQWGILLTGCGAVLLLGIPDSWTSWKKWKRWAPLLGLLSQPLWFYFARTNKAWGLFFLNIAYTASWLNGVYLNWVGPWLAARAGRKLSLKSVSQ